MFSPVVGLAKTLHRSLTEFRQSVQLAKGTLIEARIQGQALQNVLFQFSIVCNRKTS
jgi:hypothetical protein